MLKKDDTCEVCFKIKCKSCGWEANDSEVSKIQTGLITECPECGWKPS